MDTCTSTTQLIEAIPACDRAPRAAVSGVKAAGMWLAPTSAMTSAVTVPTSAKYFHRQMNVPAARGGPS